MALVHGGLVASASACAMAAYAASLWQQLAATRYQAPIGHRVQSIPLPMHALRHGTCRVEPPALLRGYLRCGAKLLSEPAWDPDFGVAGLSAAAARRPTCASAAVTIADRRPYWPSPNLSLTKGPVIASLPRPVRVLAVRSPAFHPPALCPGRRAASSPAVLAGVHARRHCG